MCKDTKTLHEVSFFHMLKTESFSLFYRLPICQSELILESTSRSYWRPKRANTVVSMSKYRRLSAFSLMAEPKALSVTLFSTLFFSNKTTLVARKSEQKNLITLFVGYKIR